MLVKVCSTKDVPDEGTLYRFEVDKMRLIVVKLSSTYIVTDSTCTHEEADLSLGILSDEIVMCPLHQARFDLRTGKVIIGPNGDDPGTIAPLHTYETKVENENLYIQT